MNYVPIGIIPFFESARILLMNRFPIGPIPFFESVRTYLMNNVVISIVFIPDFTTFILFMNHASMGIIIVPYVESI